MRNLSRREMLKLAGLGTVGAFLAACSPQSTAQPAEITRQVEVTRVIEGTPVVITTTPQPVAPIKEHITLKVWDQFTSDPGKTAMDKIYSNFMVKFPNVTIDRQLVGTADADTTARTALASGAGPDLVYLDISPTYDLIDADLILPLEDFISLYDWTNIFTEQAMQYTTYKGKIYGLGGEAEFVGTWVNKTLFEKEGWSIPTKLSEVLDWAPKAIEKGYDIPISNWIGNYGGTFGWMTNPLHNYMGVEYIRDILFNAKGTFDSPDTIRAIEILYKDMRDAGCWGTEPLTDYSASTDLFYQQKTPFLHMGTWEMPTMDVFMKENSLDIGYQPFFDMENGHPPVFTQGMGSAWYISKATAIPETAASWLNYFFTDLEAKRAYIEEGRYFPPIKYDTSLYSFSPLQQMVAENLQNETMGYNIDVLLPHSWAVTNFDGATAVWLGQQTVPELMAANQAVYESDFLSKLTN